MPVGQITYTDSRFRIGALIDHNPPVDLHKIFVQRVKRKLAVTRFNALRIGNLALPEDHRPPTDSLPARGKCSRIKETNQRPLVIGEAEHPSPGVDPVDHPVDHNTSFIGRADSPVKAKGHRGEQFQPFTLRIRGIGHCRHCGKVALPI